MSVKEPLVVKGKLTRSQEYYLKNKAKVSRKNRKYYEENRERVRKQQREYYLKNREHLKDVRREHYHANWKECRERQAKYYKTYREILNAKRREYFKGNSRARMVKNLRSRLSSIMRGKSKNTMDFIGCDKGHLNRHMEVQFKKGMTWQNYGKVWVVDHHIPISAFDYDNPKEVDACWHFSNLKPMWVKENMSKGNTICLER
jgi:hypothetical protein